MSRLPQKVSLSFLIPLLIFNTLLLLNLILHLEDNMYTIQFKNNVSFQTLWKAKRYKKYLASGCCGCWSNCDHDIEIQPDRNEIKAYKKVYGG